MSVIGVPGMTPGAADLVILPGGSGMEGHLTRDNQTPVANYGYVPAAREQFDTRSVSDCDTNSGACRVSQQIGSAGDPGPRSTVNNGYGGYLVSAYDRHSLERQDAQFFTTATSGQDPGSASSAVFGLTAFIEKWADAGALIVITSQHTPGQSPSRLVDDVSRFAWNDLARQIAAIGGTRHRFNASAIEPKADYTLVGWAGAGQGNGGEAMGEEARIRGALVPNHQSLFTPANVDTAGAPAEQLLELVVRRPFKTWPLDDDPKASNALAYLGKELEIGDPRSAYWVDGGLTADSAQDLVNRLNCSEPPCAVTMPDAANVPAPPNDFTGEDFTKAKGQLLTEMGYVVKVRGYLDQLADQTNRAGASAWDRAQGLEQDLLNQLTFLDEEQEVPFEVFEVARGLLEVASLGVSEDLAKMFEGAAAMTEFANALVEANYDGSSSIEESPTVVANKLGERLSEEAEATARSFDRIGDIIVSDWTKLQEVAHAGCIPNGGCPSGFEEYGFTEDMKDVAYDAAKVALDRTIHQTLVSAAFPVWNTGVSPACDSTAPCPPPPIDHFDCHPREAILSDAPAPAYFQGLEELDPSPQGRSNVWRTWATVTETTRGYGYPSGEILDRMFNPSNPRWLVMTPEDFFREAPSKFRPFYRDSCLWNNVDRPNLGG